MNRVGRGGAGNFKPAPDPQSAASGNAEPDLELGRTTSNTSTSNNPQAQPPNAPLKPSANPIKTGRGGAGNMSTEEAQARTAFENTLKASTRYPMSEAAAAAGPSGTGAGGVPAAAVAANPPQHRGRGGAGNFAGNVDQAAAEEKRVRAAQRTRQDEVNREVVLDVEANLAMPAVAHTSVKRGDLDR